MSNSEEQRSELPPPIMTSEPGSFAQQTILERKPQILREVMEHNDYPLDIVEALLAFKAEIAGETIRPLHEQAHDAGFWNGELARYTGRTWLEVPWYLAETYFYRRLLEAVRYFEFCPWMGLDPFQQGKAQQVRSAVERLAQGWDELVAAGPQVVLEALLYSCLWGNRADLSNYTVRLAAQGGLQARDERANLLVDHSERVTVLLGSGLARVDFVNDNVGLDLLFDLALADFVLAQGWVEQVFFHLKDYPFFVSDATATDVLTALASFESAVAAGVRDLGARLRSHVGAGRLTLVENGFWTSCLMFRQMPERVREDFTRSQLVILKGDVNYRRLLDDRHWPHTTRLEEVAAYFPAPFLVLRTLKSEIMVGLDSGHAEALAAIDPDWLINGKRGILQLVT